MRSWRCLPLPRLPSGFAAQICDSALTLYTNFVADDSHCAINDQPVRSNTIAVIEATEADRQTQLRQSLASAKPERELGQDIQPTPSCGVVCLDAEVDPAEIFSKLEGGFEAITVAEKSSIVVDAGLS